MLSNAKQVSVIRKLKLIVEVLRHEHKLIVRKKSDELYKHKITKI